MANELKSITPEQLAWADQMTVNIMESVTINDDWPIPVRLRGHIKKYPARDLRGFFELVDETLTDFQDRCNTVASERVSFVEEGPPTDFKSEVITFKVLERRPGAHTGSVPDILANDSSIKREWRPRIRYIKKDPNRPLQSTMVMGQKFDNVVEFTCWAKTNKAVDARALWFEEFMDARHWYFKYMGVEEVIFKQRLADKYWEDTRTSGNLLKSRSMHYYVRTDRTFEVSASTLRDLLVNIAVGVG